ncbi:MAG: SRPBCC domain-containing protein [Bacteroidia bacterium]|nr:SRPBCC domain-containing protein [Bacteroidia bacterium]
MKFEKITIKAVIESDINKVWEYYTDPVHITKWNFASNDWECPTASVDLRVGGKMNSRMQAKDGSFGFDFEATYTEIILFEKIAYLIPDGRNVNINFNTNGNNTEVVLIFDAETINSLELQQKGWQAILDNFKNYTENN